MREYEERQAAKGERAKARAEARGTDTGEVSSSAMDQGDESSVNSDMVPVSNNVQLADFGCWKHK